MHPASSARTLVGQVIQNARLAKGWSAEHAAAQAEIAQKTWMRVENGEGVRSNSLTAIARLFGLPDDALLTALSREHGYLELADLLGVEAPGSTPPPPPEPPPNIRDLIRRTPMPVTVGELSMMLVEKFKSMSPAEAELLRALLHYNSTVARERSGDIDDVDGGC